MDPSLDVFIGVIVLYSQVKTGFNACISDTGK